MALSEEAKKLFDYLPSDGTKVGGITIKKDLQWGTVKFTRAKDELREEGLVAFGRGRGGSVARVEGKEIPQGPTPGERMAMARAAKVDQRNTAKRRDELVERARKEAEKNFPNADEIEVVLHGTPLRPVVTVWRDRRGVNYTFKGGEWEL